MIGAMLDVHVVMDSLDWSMRSSQEEHDWLQVTA